MKSVFAAGILAAAAVLSTTAARAQALPDSPQAQVPDSPRPQIIPNAAAITPGKGTSASNDLPADDPNAPASTLGSRPAATTLPADTKNEIAPDLTPETGAGGRAKPLQVTVNFVEVPFTVKDNKGNLVPAIDWREVQVYESGVRQHMRLFTTDPYPLSVAFIIDQSVPYQTMKSVNTALGAVQGAFTPYDTMSIFTFNNGTQQKTDYSKADGNRIAAVLEQSKSEGREANFAALGNGGPLEQNIEYNNHANDNIDPNTNRNHGTGGLQNNTGNIPKEQHPLNDAIFEAAKSLTTQPIGRRRVIYVVSDGRESGSKVKSKELVKFLQTNNIALYATVVGDSATPYVGFLDKYHIPFTMKENVLPQYASATGGQAISEYRTKGIETSFAKIAEEVRVQYTAGYYSTEPFIDGKYRPIEVRVLRPGLDIISKKGYWPTPTAIRSGSTVAPQ